MSACLFGIFFLSTLFAAVNFLGKESYHEIGLPHHYQFKQTKNDYQKRNYELCDNCLKITPINS